MNVYIWHRLDYVTHNFHQEGGVVIVAASLEAARELFKQEKDRPAECEIYTTQPDRVIYRADPESKPEVFIFPDAGCC